MNADIGLNNSEITEARTHNSNYPKVAVQWLYQALRTLQTINKRI